ncbi:MAG TPA: IclR family transcriptional regulator [Gaiellaceae bacterium]|nr:IclR family transcriptional regulator [Gaiellaceae bacterium]
MATTTSGTQSIDRAAQLLVRVVENPEPTSVGSLSKWTGLPKSTTSRLVRALERQGLVQRDGARGSLSPGPVLVRFAGRGRAERDLAALSAAALTALADRTGETVNLAVAGPLGVEHLAQRDSRHFLGGTNWVGRRVPFHCTANGKVLLAFGAARLPDGELDRLAPRTVVDRDALERELDEIRRRGYGSAVDELEPGLAAVAAPVHAGATAAALSVSGPTVRMTATRLRELGALLVARAADLSATLDHDDTKRGAA